MKSNEERIELMHEKAKKLQYEKNRRLTVGSIIVGALLFAVLVAASLGLGVQIAGTSETTFAASSLFPSTIGGYVMVAVMAFMMGVVITVILKKRAKKRD